MNMAYNCELKNFPAQNTLFVRVHTSMQDLGSTMGQCLGKVMAYLGEQKQYPAGAPFASYQNMSGGSVDAEIGFPVAQAMSGNGDVIAGTIPANTYATCIHQGPYDGVSGAYQTLMQWIPRAGYHIAGPAYEIYLNDPSKTAPSDLQTLVMFPVQMNG